jgi:hypothetical protein
MKETMSCGTCGRPVPITRYAKGNAMAKCSCGQTAFFSKAAIAAFDAKDDPPHEPQSKPPTLESDTAPEPKKNQRTLWERIVGND